MAIRINKSLIFSYDNYEQFQKHLAAGRLRTAALILYLNSKRLFPDLDPDVLYNECWRKTLALQLGKIKTKVCDCDPVQNLAPAHD